MNNNYVYMTLLTNNTYVQGVILLNETLKQVNSKYPLVVLVTNDVAQATLDILDYLKIQWKLVDIIKFQEIEYINQQKEKSYTKNNNKKWWGNAFTKLQVFNQIEYDKIIYLDCDIMILKNIDHLFKEPYISVTIDGGFYGNNYLNYFNNQRNFNSGFFIITPSQEEYKNIIIFIKDKNNYKKIKKRALYFGDQEFLNLYYKNSNNKHILSNLYNITVNSHLKMPQQAINNILLKGYFIHFISAIKPWDYENIKLFKNKQNIHKEYYFTYIFQKTAAEIIQQILFSLPSKLILNFFKVYLKEIQS